jgi:hypothetical protein
MIHPETVARRKWIWFCVVAIAGFAAMAGIGVIGKLPEWLAYPFFIAWIWVSAKIAERLPTGR